MYFTYQARSQPIFEGVLNMFLNQRTTTVFFGQ